MCVSHDHTACYSEAELNHRLLAVVLQATGLCRTGTNSPTRQCRRPRCLVSATRRRAQGLRAHERSSSSSSSAVGPKQQRRAGTPCHAAAAAAAATAQQVAHTHTRTHTHKQHTPAVLVRRAEPPRLLAVALQAKGLCRTGTNSPTRQSRRPRCLVSAARRRGCVHVSAAARLGQSRSGAQAHHAMQRQQRAAHTETTHTCGPRAPRCPAVALGASAAACRQHWRGGSGSTRESNTTGTAVLCGLLCSCVCLLLSFAAAVVCCCCPAVLESAGCVLPRALGSLQCACPLGVVDAAR
jgi:hypothetical protein